jgi:hypothetical protein
MGGKVTITRPESDFPELIVNVPSKWPYVQLAPLYDVHLGNNLHSSAIFKRHAEWLAREPYTLTFNGGDLIENSILGSPGIFSQDSIPDTQFDNALKVIYPLKDKMLFALSGNHEFRTFRQTGFDLAKHLAQSLGIEYFPDFCFCSIRWKGQTFRIAAHHGTGAAQSPGGQRNAARKDMPWLEADVYWTGHLHQPLVDLVYRVDNNQQTGRTFTRQSFAIVSPSYVKFFGGYGAAKRYAPGAIGLIAVTLHEDGRMDSTLHAKGRRL